MQIKKVKEIEGYRRKVTKWIHEMPYELFHGRFSGVISRKEAKRLFARQNHGDVAALDERGNVCGVIESTNHGTHITFSILANPGYGQALIRWLKRAYPGKPIGGSLRDPLDIRSTLFFMRHCDFLSSDLLSSVVSNLAKAFKVKHNSEVVSFYFKDHDDLIKKAEKIYPIIFNGKVPKRLTKEVLLLALMFESIYFIPHVCATVFHVLGERDRTTIAITLQCAFRTYCLAKGIPKEYFDLLLSHVIKIDMINKGMSMPEIKARLMEAREKPELLSRIARAYEQFGMQAANITKEYKPL